MRSGFTNRQGIVFDPTKLDTFYAEDAQSFVDNIRSLLDNIVLTNFRLQMASAISLEKFKNGVTDEFVDQTGVDLDNSVNEVYSSAGQFYEPFVSGGLGVDLLAHYKMNDYLATPDVVDDVGGFNGLAQQNTDDISVAGKINLALSFNGSTDKIVTSAIPTVGSGDVSLAYQFYVVDPAGYQDICGNLDAVSSNGGFRCYFQGGNLYTNGTFGGATYSDVIPCSSGAWHSFIQIRQGDTYSIYLDGVFVVSHTVAGVFGFDGYPLCMGFNPYGGGCNFFNGWLDDVRFYSRGLTSDECVTIAAGTEDEGVGLISDMTLISNSQSALTSPKLARVVLLEEDVDSITLNTDLIVSVSRNGTTWFPVTIENEGDFGSSKNILAGEAPFTGGAGTSLKWKIETANNKDLKIHAVGLLWE